MNQRSLPIKAVPLLSIASSLALLIATSAHAQTQVYSQDFEIDDTLNWTVNQTSGSNYANFFFDYSTIGIPQAPIRLVLAPTG